MGYLCFKDIHMYRFTSYPFILNMPFPCELKLQLQEGQQKYSLEELKNMLQPICEAGTWCIKSTTTMAQELHNYTLQHEAQ